MASGGGVGGAVRDVASKAELDEALSGGGAVAIHFWASWCEASKHMDEVFAHLATDFPHALFLRVEAEEQPEISEPFRVAAVPYFAFCKDGKTVDTLEGANPSSLANKVAKLAGPANLSGSAAPASLGVAAGPTIIEKIQEMARQNGSSSAATSTINVTSSASELNVRLQGLVDSHPIFLFMKGTPEQPRCKFSRKVVEILNEEGVEFGSFDILTDDSVREGMKKFSNWPTFPQLFCKGEFVGGCDIVTAMHESGELKDVFREHGIGGDAAADAKPVNGLSSALVVRLQSLINSAPVMLFMKGTTDEPKCGLSNKVVEILKQEGVPFQSFDILADEEVQQGLKVFSNWPSYPQLYIKGEFVGGSDIVVEMQRSGQLKAVLAEKGLVSLEDRLRGLLSSSPVMLFMKGTPEVPRCGFSAKVVDALRKEGVEFGSFDILTDEEVRQGLKAFSNWPTYPQLYYKGELIGGCDIVMELQRSGELKPTLTE